jgi:ABC-2 type transport system ATP-binding protein
MFGRLSGLGPRAARARADELLARFGLLDSAAKRVRSYSGGMRRRLDLALSFVVTPEVLFLDEPTTGLDTTSRRQLWDVIRTLAGAGTTVFLTTQYLEEADHLADRVAVLDDGRIVADDTPAALKSRIGGDVVELRDHHDALVREVPTDGSVSGLRRALDVLDEAGAEGVVTLRRPSLDDVFLSLTGGSTAAVPLKESA